MKRKGSIGVASEGQLRAAARSGLKAVSTGACDWSSAVAEGAFS